MAWISDSTTTKATVWGPSERHQQPWTPFPSLPLSLEVEPSQEWSHQNAALQTSPGGKSSVSHAVHVRKALTNYVGKIACELTTRKKWLFIHFLSCRLSSSPLSFGKFWGKSQSYRQGFFFKNAVQCWSTVFFQVRTCDAKKKKEGEKWMWVYFLWKWSNFFCCQSVPDMSAYLQNDLNRLLRWLDKRLLCLPLPFHPFTSIIIIWKKLFLLLPCALLSFPTKTTKKHPNRPVTFLLIVIHIVWLSVLNVELFKLFTVCGFVLRLLFNSALPQSC